ncbi:MAG: TolC family protein, partial [Bacteroidales bacterium]|nr:TolC family protein [Bacteroidales bacterium]
LIVLPILYYLYEKSKEKRLLKKSFIAPVLLLLMVLPLSGKSQQVITLEKAIEIGMENSPMLKSGSLQVDEKKELIGAAIDLNKTNVYYNFDENNLGLNGLPIKVWGVSQAFRFPTAYVAQNTLAKGLYEKQMADFMLQKQSFTEELTLAYYQLVYLIHKKSIYSNLDSLYSKLANAATRKYELGDQNYLEMLSAQAQQQEIKMKYRQLEDEIHIAYLDLNRYLGLEEPFVLADKELKKIDFLAPEIKSQIQLQILEIQKMNALSETQLAKTNLLPDLNLEYFQGKNNGPAAKLYQGFTVGVDIPIWFKATQSKVKATRINQAILDSRYQDLLAQLNTRKNQLLSALNRDAEAVHFYESRGKTLAKELRNAAEKSYAHGEINFLQFVQSFQSAQAIELNYLDNLISYNNNSIRLKYLNLK